MSRAREYSTKTPDRLFLALASLALSLAALPAPAQTSLASPDGTITVSLSSDDVGRVKGIKVDFTDYSVEVTGFRSTLTEHNFDFTRINNPPPNNNPNISNSYRSYGIEFTGRLTTGAFHRAVDATYSNSKITDSATAALEGNRPGGLPEFLFVVSPSYDAGIVAAGFSVNGQTSTYSDDFNLYKITGSTFVNGFVTVRPVERVELGLNVNTLFDKLGFRGGGNLFPVLSSTSAMFNNTALYGRTITASIRYRS